MATRGMTFEEYMVAYGRARYEHPEWRAGQAAFNVLPTELSEEIVGTDLDPFNFARDPFTDEYLAWLLAALERNK